MNPLTEQLWRALMACESLEDLEEVAAGIRARTQAIPSTDLESLRSIYRIRILALTPPSAKRWGSGRS